MEEVEDLEESDAYELHHKYLSEVERLWWGAWRNKALKSLVPFHSAKQGDRHRDLQPGDVVLLLKETKISASYRLARVVEAKVSEADGVVWTVKIAFLKRNILKKAARYNQSHFETKEVAVQSLALLVSAEAVDRKFWEFETNRAEFD